MIPAESSDLTVQVPNGRRSWSLTDEWGLGPIFGSRFSRVVENVRSYGGTGDERSVTFATKESRFHSMNLCIRVYSTLFGVERGWKTTCSSRMKVNHSVKPRKSVSKVSRLARGLTRSKPPVVFNLRNETFLRRSFATKEIYRRSASFYVSYRRNPVSWCEHQVTFSISHVGEIFKVPR